MRKLNPEWIRVLQENINTCPYFTHQSMQVVELGAGTSRVEIEVQKKHQQPFGMVHGGVFSGLIDAAGFWAVYPEVRDDLSLTTVEMKLNYLAPANDGLLIGFGQRLKLGKTIALAQSRIEDQEGRLLAHGLVTLMILPGLPLTKQDNLPPKYL